MGFSASIFAPEEECEQLPSVSVSAKDLVLLPAAVVKPTPRSERSVEDIAGVLSTHCESIEVIQNKIIWSVS